MNLLISASSLGHLKCINDEPFVRSTRKKNSNHSLLCLQNVLPYKIIKCKMHYLSLKKIAKFKILSNNKYRLLNLENIRVNYIVEPYLLHYMSI